MRLIDADKLMESLNPKESVWVGLVLSELIVNTPIIEAIPVEWIVKYLHELDKQAEEEADFIINELGGYGTFYYKYCAKSIADMLKKWESENEAY